MFKNLIACCVVLAGLLGRQSTPPPADSSPTQPPPLNYEFFRDKVEPVFLAHRPGHARCVACHSRASNHAPLRLVPLSPGSTTWTEEPSRQNFENVKVVVVPGKPDESPLLFHPLAEKAGGDFFHGGGKHFDSKDNPEWQVMKAWVLGQTE